MSFKTQLSKLRKRNNITQTDLAKRLDVKQYVISSWETGRTEPNIEQIIILSDIFQVPIDYLLDKEIIRTTNDDDFKKVIENINMDAQDEFISEIKKISENIPDNKKDKILNIIKELVKY